MLYSWVKVMVGWLFWLQLKHGLRVGSWPAPALPLPLARALPERIGSLSELPYSHVENRGNSTKNPGIAPSLQDMAKVKGRSQSKCTVQGFPHKTDCSGSLPGKWPLPRPPTASGTRSFPSPHHRQPGLSTHRLQFILGEQHVTAWDLVHILFPDQTIPLR